MVRDNSTDDITSLVTQRVEPFKEGARDLYKSQEQITQIAQVAKKGLVESRTLTKRLSELNQDGKTGRLQLMMTKVAGLPLVGRIPGISNFSEISIKQALVISYQDTQDALGSLESQLAPFDNYEQTIHSELLRMIDDRDRAQLRVNELQVDVDNFEKTYGVPTFEPGKTLDRETVERKQAYHRLKRELRVESVRLNSYNHAIVDLNVLAEENQQILEASRQLSDVIRTEQDVYAPLLQPQQKMFGIIETFCSFMELFG